MPSQAALFRFKISRVGVAIVLMFLSAVAAQADDLSSGERVLFNRDVRPILSDKCFACHGPDKNEREAELRLDTEAGLLGVDGEPGVVVPMKSAESRLVERIRAEDVAERMPPEEFGKPLSDTEIETLRRWIDQGASWEGHWSFLPIEPPQDAASNHHEDWIRNEIDRQVLLTMREHELAPSAPADPRTLLRRVSLDLTGLPPTPERVSQILQDTTPGAWERYVDDLLASPAHAERMAVWWLDLVRYADSVGYHGDQEVSVHPYREYVIQSFWRNKPFDVFTREQLAGDLLPQPTQEQRIASGYNRLGMMSAEGGVQDKEYLAKYIAERVRNLSGAWLGVTLGCCECHDHKYDPFKTKDFYSLEAFFADIEERGLYSGANADGNWGPRISAPTPEQSQKLAELETQISATGQVLATNTPDLEREQLAWEQRHIEWTTLAPASVVSAEGATLTVQANDAVLASGASPTTDVYTVSFTGLSGTFTAIRLETLPDESLPQLGPGRADNGNFVLSEFDAKVSSSAEGTDARTIAFQSATATFEQTAYSEGHPNGRWAVAAAIDGDQHGPTWGWAIAEQVGQSQSAVFVCSEPVEMVPADVVTLTLRQSLDSPRHTLGKFRLAIAREALPARMFDYPPPAIAAILVAPGETRSTEQQAELAAHFRSIAPSLDASRSRLAVLTAERDALGQSISTSLVTAAVEPRMIRVLARGNWMDESGEIVKPGFPDCLPSSPTADRRLNRLDLANWVVSPENPLTARVFVNRVWKLLFGAGLSRRVDDLGAQGEWPSHPELLDWLAADFRDHGWDVRRLVRQIVLSNAYQQSSVVSNAARELDPANRWLARQSAFRLDAEFVRDNALSVSGLLVERVGGPSVRPYQPPGFWAYLNFPQREWQNSQGDGLHRRGVYTHWQRQYLHPSLSAFDAPSREECTADRPRSNTPMQALVLLNDPTYVEAARAFAAKLMREGGADTDARIHWAFERALLRPAKPEEVAALQSLYEKHLAQLRDDPAAVAALTGIDENAASVDIDRSELAAWTSVSRAILNLHETVTRN